MTSFSLRQRALPCPLAHRTPESGWGFQVLSRLRTPGPAFAPSAKVGSVFWASMSVMGADVEKTIVTTAGSWLLCFRCCERRASYSGTGSPARTTRIK
jgi:hypothetical protein